MKFSKPATTIDQQIDLLVSRGMAIPDRDKARHYLNHISYTALGPTGFHLKPITPPMPFGQASHLKMC